MADKFDPWGAAATYVGAKAKENPACSDADAKLLESIGGHGSEANFESLGKAIDAAGDTVEKLEKTSKHHANIATNKKREAEDALAAKRAKKGQGPPRWWEESSKDSSGNGDHPAW